MSSLEKLIEKLETIKLNKERLHLNDSDVRLIDESIEHLEKGLNDQNKLTHQEIVSIIMFVKTMAEFFSSP